MLFKLCRLSQHSQFLVSSIQNGAQGTENLLRSELPETRLKNHCTTDCEHKQLISGNVIHGDSSDMCGTGSMGILARCQMQILWVLQQNKSKDAIITACQILDPDSDYSEF